MPLSKKLSDKKLKEAVFFLLIFLLPSQLAFHFWPEFSFVRGVRVDYLSPAVYLTDLLLIVFCFFELKQNKVRLDKRGISFFLFTLVFVALNVFLSMNKGAAVYKWSKTGLLFLFAFLVSRRNKKTFFSKFKKPFVYSLAVVLFLAVLQFVLKKSLGGPFYLLGERSFNLETPGLATEKLFDKNVLRAYASFSHPNSLAGFLSVSMLLFLAFKKRLSRREKAFLSFTFLTLLLTFSKGGALAIFAGAVVYFLVKRKIVAKALVKILITGFFAVSLFLPFWLTSNRAIFSNSQSYVTERISLIEKSGKVFIESFYFGVGFNNFIGRSVNLSKAGEWLPQPVHNIYLLVASELGVVGLILFYFLLIKAVDQMRKGSLLSAPLVSLLVGGLVDHYWLTLQQNLLLFSFLMGVIFQKEHRYSKDKDEEN